jgi:hypothetical protein
MAERRAEVNNCRYFKKKAVYQGLAGVSFDNKGLCLNL